MRLLNQVHGAGTERIRREYPEVDVVEVPIEGDVDPEITGDALVCLTLASNLDQLVPRVKWVHSFSTGVDGLPEAVFTAELLTCSRGAGAVPISEFVLAAMLAFEKNIPDVWIHEVPEHWNFADLGGLSGRSVGLIGLGGIGEAVARRSLAFGMDVTAYRRRPLPSSVSEVLIVSSLGEVLSSADHLVVAAPYTPRTHHLLDASAFAQMREGVHLVNIARGGLIDQDALRTALDDGRVAMATLDTVDPEPLPAGHWMYTHPRVRLSPHVSWSSPEGGRKIFELFLENLGRYLRAEPLEGVVDKDERY
ncbi:MAG: dihydrofolate reductase [Acidimicrobiia bacterium]|nr:dihydrofolate reductase [Acidimicrobiia bacterium]